MMFYLLLALAFCISFYLSFYSLTGVTVAIYGTIIVIFLKKILDTLNKLINK